MALLPLGHSRTPRVHACPTKKIYVVSEKGRNHSEHWSNASLRGPCVEPSVLTILVRVSVSWHTSLSSTPQPRNASRASARRAARSSRSTLSSCFVTAVGREFILQNSLTKQVVRHVRPMTFTEGYAADWTMHWLRDAVQRIANSIDDPIRGTSPAQETAPRTEFRQFAASVATSLWLMLPLAEQTSLKLPSVAFSLQIRLSDFRQRVVYQFDSTS